MSEGKKQSRAWSQGKIKRAPAKRRRKEALAPGERRRLGQLVVCVVLFAAVFLGQGLPLGRFSALGDEIAALIHHNTDFKGAFTRMGHSVSEGEPFVETFGTLWSEMFGLEDGEGQTETLLPEDAPPEGQTEPAPLAQPLGEGETLLPQETQSQAEETPAEPAASAAPAEPAAAETVTPVMGVLASGFGYRNHPIDGEWNEHQGVDIDAAAGTPILAYTAGEVDYIGESEAYGLYMQLKHPDGVTTFYAHCLSICVKPGQRVAAGEKIGEVGATGNTTGPHLHLEMKRDGIRVDPLDYIETLSS